MKTFLLKRGFLIVAGIALAFSSCVLPQSKDVNKPPRSVTVSGTGTVSVQADVATINFAVITTNRSVIEASNLNAENISAIRKALMAEGYSPDSIVTDSYTIAQESYRNGVPYGDYRVTNSVHIVVKNINNIGNVIDTAIKAGANHVSSIDFSVSEIENGVREARTAAVKQAYEAANLMVKTAGSELGAIISIKEQRFGGAIPVPMMNNSSVYGDVAENATSVTPGKQKISVTVECTYEIQ